MSDADKAKRLAAEVRACDASTQIDLAGVSGLDALAAIVNEGLSKPFPLKQMIRISFIVGGGKKVRQRYDDKLPQMLSDALKAIGFAEDRGASATLSCQGLFKYQHDTDKDLKFVHTFPRVDPSAAAAPAGTDTGEGAMSPAEMLLFADQATFEAMIRAKTVSFSQRRRALEVLKEATAQIASLEAQLTAMTPLTDGEQAWYDSVDADGISHKQAWLQQNLESMVNEGQLTSGERAEVLEKLTAKLAVLEEKLAAAEAAGKSKQAAALVKARDEMQARNMHLRGIACVTHRPKHAAEMARVRKKLAEVEKLEKSKVLLPLEEAQKLNAKPKLLAELEAMEIDAAGWFSR
uniref:Uncharacterized protein n=1 Tax=Calcidiscus leptoporus TaxID=127549 RepID=A0A7S0NXG6_9EUKA|mmetsp:Transcript_3817/g.8653  ORF Transcript_3817/g.8653 Transcript_3817/m.8653 type:complete len:349 (+) Transcript_3817:23-1069(+)|eukprot:CAMPEP_0119377212 /NCGR_PEP_ID=MMETSP1334-20130426/43744_1 /TAXON_ID=127549 /ORGANISM="Calcidiscus leptoporus, Strain RCC1130" /LENGTH=348 /DNA_ID=CAMNT_0007396041 /DNA_START=22 /DNA_END=1068 /DNA_ORIENTATION=+